MKYSIHTCVALLFIDNFFIGKYEAATYIGLVIFIAMLCIIFRGAKSPRK